MTIIEKNEDNITCIMDYYNKDMVLFEHTILESEKFTYSICYCPRQDVYDVILTGNRDSVLINYEAREKLSGSTLKYFNSYKDDTVKDMFGNIFYCKTHYVEIDD